MARVGTRGGAAGLAAAGLLLASCAATGPAGSGRPADPADEAAARSAAWSALVGELDDFAVAGAVHTDEGLLLPENITIEIHSEICVESRAPGSRFWSLDYDTCFVFTATDTVDARGEYSVRVPCTDADRQYVRRHAFGDLRLVQRGPVTFLAESDAGWRHQETFTSSRTQRRDLVLTLDTEVFWVIDDDAVLRDRPRPDRAALAHHPFGTPVDVIRFHQGWAQVRLGRHIGWMEMRCLGTEQEMKEKAPFKGKTAPRALPDDR